MSEEKLVVDLEYRRYDDNIRQSSGNLIFGKLQIALEPFDKKREREREISRTIDSIKTITRSLTQSLTVSEFVLVNWLCRSRVALFYINLLQLWR